MHIFILLIFLTCNCKITTSQNVRLPLMGGVFVGQKVFPESTTQPVHAYLGIPYAKAPKRFEPPVAVKMRNFTYYATNFKPLCPTHLHTYQKRTSEDCLFLNIWVPVLTSALDTMPVLIVIFDDGAHDWSINPLSGIDMSTEGMIVVAIQYRTNALGWFTLRNERAPGNLALLDQKMAINWVVDNINQFGGDVNRLVILGHGSTGVYCVFHHLTSPQTKHLFSGGILMSGSLYSIFFDSIGSSKELIKLLACDKEKQVLECLQEKNLNDLLMAQEKIYKDVLPGFVKFGPIFDEFSEEPQIGLQAPTKIISQINSIKVPIMFGINSNEASFFADHFLEHAKKGFTKLNEFIRHHLINEILKHYNHRNFVHIKNAILWNYFQDGARSTSNLLNCLINFYSQVGFELPFFKSIEHLAKSEYNDSYSDENSSSMRNVYIYIFHHTNSIDLKGNINLFNGASHTSEFPFLFGPTLFKQIARRKLTTTEEKLCKKLHSLFGDFVKYGNPTPNRLFDAWKPYSDRSKYIKVIGTKIDDLFRSKILKDYQFEKNSDKIESLLRTGSNMEDNDSRYSTNFNGNDSQSSESRNIDYYLYLKRIEVFWFEYLEDLEKLAQEIEVFSIKDIENASIKGFTKYKHAFFSMLILVCLLLTILVLSVFILRKNNAISNFRC